MAVDTPKFRTSLAGISWKDCRFSPYFGRVTAGQPLETDRIADRETGGGLRRSPWTPFGEIARSESDAISHQMGDRGRVVSPSNQASILAVAKAGCERIVAGWQDPPVRSQNRQSWGKYVATFSLSGSLALFAATFSTRKPQKFFPYYLGLSVLLHVGLLTLFTRLIKKPPKEPEPFEIELVSPEPTPPTPPLPPVPPSILPPGDDGTSERRTPNKRPETTVRREPKKPPAVRPPSPYAQPHDQTKPPSPNRTPRIGVPRASFGEESPTSSLSEEGKIPQAREGEKKEEQTGPEGESITPLAQAPSNLYEGQAIEAEAEDGAVGTATLFGRQIKNRLTLDKKKKHYQIAFLIDCSGSMIQMIEHTKKIAGQIMQHAREQLTEGGNVTFALWIYVDDIVRPLKGLRSEQELIGIPPEQADAFARQEIIFMRRALDQAVEITLQQNGQLELVFDASYQLIRSERFSTSDEIAKTILVLTDDTAGQEVARVGNEVRVVTLESLAGNTYETILDEARRHSISYEFIRRRNF